MRLGLRLGVERSGAEEGEGEAREKQEGKAAWAAMVGHGNDDAFAEFNIPTWSLDGVVSLMDGSKV